MLNIFSYQGNENKNHNEIPLQLTQMTIIKKIMPVGEAMEKLEFSHIVSRKVMVQLLWKQFGSSLNVKYRVVYMTLYDSAVPLLGGFLEN